MNDLKYHMSALWFLFLLILFVRGGAAQQELEPNEREQHEVSVNVKLLPIFAVYRDGSPVFDLQAGELELFVNNKPVPISFFKRYDFAAGKIEKKIEQKEDGERAVFIILDSMFNSNESFRRSRVIAVNLIKQGGPGDRFIVFENNLIGGLMRIAGPDEERETIIKKINQLKKPVDQWASQLFSSRDITNNIDFTLQLEERLETNVWESVRQMNLQSERLRYRHHAKQFSLMLARFQYILKTIDIPKVVFLISEGLATGAFNVDKSEGPDVLLDEARVLINNDELRRYKFQSILVADENNVSEQNGLYSSNLFTHLKEVVRAINYGGSMIYTVNPRRPNDTNDEAQAGEMSLRFLARESGGGYFAGSDPFALAKSLSQSTSAYYEMAFYNEPDAGEELNVRINCKREGVQVRTTTYTERSRNYSEMDQIQKKMFALNVIHGGGWSKHLGKVMPARFRKKENSLKSESVQLDVALPKEMKNRLLDIFIINMDPVTREVDMKMDSTQARDWIQLKFNGQKDRQHYFVIIEPEKTYCLFNKS